MIAMLAMQAQFERYRVVGDANRVTAAEARRGEVNQAAPRFFEGWPGPATGPRLIGWLGTSLLMSANPLNKALRGRLRD